VGRVLRLTRHITGHFRHESFQAITCSGTVKQNKQSSCIAVKESCRD